MRKLLFSAVAATGLMAAGAQAQNITMTMASAQPGGASDIAAKVLAEVAASKGIATIQTQGGKVLTKTLQEVVEGKLDLTTNPFVLGFLMSKGLGPYSGLGKEKGAQLAGNIRLLFPFHIATFYLVSFQSKNIDSWDKIKGKTIHNGPPRGGALISARSIIRLVAGMTEGKGYTGKQIAWGQANSIFLDGSVDAAVRPSTNPSAFLPVFMAAGKINLVSIPKAKFESADMQKYIKAPGNAANVFPISELAHLGDGARIISEDNMYRAVANTAGIVVHKKMDKALAKSLTAAFLANLPNMYKNIAFAKSSHFGKIDNKLMGICTANVVLHPGAVEAWEEAGHKIEDCMKPKG